MSDTPKHYDPKAVLPEDTITLSSAALIHIKEQIAKRGSGIGIRLGTKVSGCSGYKYAIDIIDKAHDDDLVFQQNETVCVAVSQADFGLLRGTKLDYIQEGLNYHFVYENPNQSGNCGCGESFSVKQ